MSTVITSIIPLHFCQLSAGHTNCDHGTRIKRLLKPVWRGGRDVRYTYPMTKLSRSKLELFIDCQRCFWLDVKHGIKRPPPAPYTINSAIDYLLKAEF